MKNQDNLKNIVAQNIKIYRKKAGLTQKQLAELLGVKNTAVSNWENGQNSIDTEILFKFCKIFNITLNDVYGIEEESSFVDYTELEKYGITPLPKMKKLPLLGAIACGKPILAEENIDGYCECPENIDAVFCLRAKGDSMIHARIFDGDVLFIRKQDIVDDGEIAAILIEDEATVKRVYYDREEGTLTLVPENPKFKIMRFHGEQLNQIRIIGKVIAGRYNVK